MRCAGGPAIHTAMTFTIEIAGAAAQITCRHAETVDFFREYLSDRPADLCIRPAEDDLRRMETMLRQAGNNADPHQVENNAIHGLLAEALIDRDVLLVHGSAVVMDGQAYIFVASSGTGKSTHTRLWCRQFGGRAWMLNDDKPMIHVSDRGAVAYGTPWNGKHRLGRNASAPVRAVAFLERGEENAVEPIGRAEAVAALIPHAIRPRDPEKMARVLALETRLAADADFWRLRCNTQPRAAVTAWNAMKG